jgi:hypothetical protein
LKYVGYLVDCFNIFLLGWVLKLCEFKYWGVEMMNASLLSTKDWKRFGG